MFQVKKKSDYPKSVKKIFNLLTINGKYQVIGSGALKKIKYQNDFDLMELFKNSKKDIKDDLYELFLNKFHEAYKNPNIYITDFKCGIDKKGEALRWGYDDMKKGINKGVKFQDALLHEAMLKMDIIAIIDGLMTEFSENYYLTLNGKSNYKKINTNKLLKQLLESYHEYYEEDNYFKALKRVFSYKLLKDKNKYKSDLKKLINFFNSKTGFKYKIKSELETMIILMENSFREVPKEQLDANIKFILNQLNSDKDIIVNKKSITNLMNEINSEAQKESLDFINKNQDILL